MGWLKDKLNGSSNADSDSNKGKSGISEADLKKFTGMDRAQLDDFAATAPGVAGNQRAGDITAGNAGGFYSGVPTYDVSQPMKFPRGQEGGQDRVEKK
jgi:hypothetical protein